MVIDERGTNISNPVKAENQEFGRVYIADELFRKPPIPTFHLDDLETTFEGWAAGQTSHTHSKQKVQNGPGYFDIEMLYPGTPRSFGHQMIGVFIPYGVDEGAVLQHLMARFGEAAVLVDDLATAAPVRPRKSAKDWGSIKIVLLLAVAVLLVMALSYHHPEVTQYLDLCK